MAARIARRLPGLRFEARSPQLAEALPRMDVAVFVGFAASGPLHLPVPVEDFAAFTAVFGPAAPLAWDAERGVQTTAYLAPAVQEFFRNGGRRCWIVRTAGAEATPNYFPLPGLACAEFSADGKLARIRPTFAQARSEGSWSDGLRVSTALLTQPVVVKAIRDGGYTMELQVSAATTIVPGDLLRLIFAQAGLVLFVQASVVRAESRGERRLLVRAKQVLWFETEIFDSPPAAESPAVAQLYTRVLAPPPAASLSAERLSEARPLPDFQGESVAARVRWRKDEQHPLIVELLAAVEKQPAPGSLVQVTVNGRKLWLTVEEARLGKAASGVAVELSGTELWLLPEPPASLPALDSNSLATAEKLNFELWVRAGESDAQRLGELGFTPDHPRYWGELPTDRQFYQAATAALFAPQRIEFAFEKERVEFWRSTSSQRFPLAGDSATNVVHFPIGMLALPTQNLPPLAQRALEHGAGKINPIDPLRRDGLAEFGAHLFLDAGLLDAGVLSLLGQADFLRYFSPAPRQLTGLHAALGFGDSAIIEEATIIAVPDAVQRDWEPESVVEPPQGLVSAPLPHPEWWTYLPCPEREKAPLTNAPKRGNFLACDLRELPAPQHLREESASTHDSFTLVWEHNAADAVFVLEEAARLNHEEKTRVVTFEQPVIIYRGKERRVTLTNRGSGVRYYRVRAEADCVTSDWSLGVGVRVSAATGYRVKATKDYSAQHLLDVQRALLRLCAARGDLLAVLALPEHYREADAEAHIKALKTEAGPLSTVRPLGHGEVQAFSYGALYHPWLIVRADGLSPSLFGIPPDGAASGIIAARAIARGAWIAPANETLRSVVALTPPIAPEQRLNLQEAQLNLLRQEPRGFLTLSADTLSNDEDLRPINVRRLLILLRRLAVRLGAQYVFEPNSDAFRRLVERGFETMLGEMFERGAFAGATPATAFQVNADTRLNALQQEQGRFIVELKVAPSLPLTFLTIRVIQAGDRTRVEEV